MPACELVAAAWQIVDNRNLDKGMDHGRGSPAAAAGYQWRFRREGRHMSESANPVYLHEVLEAGYSEDEVRGVGCGRVTAMRRASRITSVLISPPRLDWEEGSLMTKQQQRPPERRPARRRRLPCRALARGQPQQRRRRPRGRPSPRPSGPSRPSSTFRRGRRREGQRRRTPQTHRDAQSPRPPSG